MSEIIVSILATEADQTVRAAARAAMGGADWIELRLDRWPLREPLRPVLRDIRLPVLVTCRTPRDGGGYEGSLRDRQLLLENGLEAGARGYDLEDWEEWEPDIDVRLRIRSYHNFKEVPQEPEQIRDRLLGMGNANVAKLVGMAHELAQAAPLMDLLSSTDQVEQRTVAFAMGRSAGVTRVLSCLLGSPYTYASLRGAAETAPGQMPLSELVGPYRVQSLGPDTRLFGLLGNPALHSLGPWLHNRALRAAGVDGIYLPFETADPLAVIDFLPRRRLVGLSVTAPHKELMAQTCHRLDPDAEACAAVNTVICEAGGVLAGYNTDVAGVLGALRRAGAPSGAGAGCVLGSGGAARAAAVALERLGLEVTILGRSLDRIRSFATARGYQLGSIRSEVLRELQPRVVVQATPVGSAGREGEARLVPDWTPPEGCYVLDMVYRPLETSLLRDVAAAGAVPVSGLEMFLTQAAEQLSLFCGHRPLEPDLRRFLAGAL